MVREVGNGGALHEGTEVPDFQLAVIAARRQHVVRFGIPGDNVDV